MIEQSRFTSGFG
ncbi:hypothetical protein RSAG8_03189, partial [Rhizoctonia solani AG-8 WAC10335]